MNNYNEIREDLNQRRSALDRRLRALARHLQDVEDARRPQGDETPEELNALYQESQRELAMVDASLRRIADRTFDICIHCGKVIPEHILSLYPFTVSCDQCNHGVDLEYYHAIHGEHADLRRSLTCARAAIAAVAHRPAGREDAPVGQSAARVMLRIVARELSDHFDHEEHGGYLEGILTRAPNLSPRVDRLRTDHGDFRQKIARVVERAGAAHGDRAAWRAVELEYGELVADLRHHEQEEDDLATIAYWDDFGGG